MFNRGNGSGLESKRSDESFYRGVVVKNDDPLKMNRVKIIIPELSNQPYEDWFEEDILIFKSPGSNTSGKNKDKWENRKLFEKIVSNLPWAEPCYPLLGESNNTRYFNGDDIKTISDCNYSEGFEIIDKEPPTIKSGSFSPAFIYETYEYAVMDSFSKPVGNFSIRCNSYGANYRPNKFVNKAKGSFSVPEIGSKVWVFHEQGDYMFPVYFGVHHDQRSLLLINECDNDDGVSQIYPSEYENGKDTIDTVTNCE